MINVLDGWGSRIKVIVILHLNLSLYRGNLIAQSCPGFTFYFVLTDICVIRLNCNAEIKLGTLCYQKLCVNIVCVTVSPLLFRDSANATWELEEASNRIEGLYHCIATNSEGSNRATTFLDVTGKKYAIYNIQCD